MSLTPTLGAVGPSYWRYTAASLVLALQKILQRRRIEGGELRPGIFEDAKRFFARALEVAGAGTSGANPTESLANYSIAARAASRRVGPGRLSFAELDQMLGQYSALVSTLTQPRELSDSEVDVANQVMVFFQQIREDGDAEAYSAVHPWLGPSPMQL